MPLTKKNVTEFNSDVTANRGYLYTTNAPLSSILSNERISRVVFSCIDESTHRLVDIGCGDGVYTNEIKERFPHIQVEGLDPATDAIDLAQKKYPKIIFSMRNILEKHTTARAVSFDIGILRGVLHHLSDQELAIRNSFEIADKLIIVEPNGNNPILKIIEKISPYHREHEEQSFTYRQLKSWCEKVGGEVLHHEYIGFVPFFCPALLARVIHFFQPLLEKIPIIKEFFSAQIVLTCKKLPAVS